MSAGPTILLVEDEPLILMDLEFAAEECGCRALAACGVGEALALIESHEPEVAVLDVTLQDGETSVPIAHELGRRGIPFIVHSGNFDRADPELRALEVELVPKPASSHHVISAALSCLRDSAGDGRRAAHC